MDESIDANRPDHNFVNVLKRFTCEISTSTETKSWKKKPARVATISKTETKKF